MNINRIFFTQFFLILYTCNFCVYSTYANAGDTWTGMKEFGKSIEGVTKMTAPVAEHLAQLFSKSGIECVNITSKTSVDLANIAAPTAEKVTQTAGTALVDASSKVGVESIDKLAAVGHGVVAVAGVAVAIHGLIQLYPIGKEIITYACPSEEQKAQWEADLKNAQNRLKMLEIEEKFRDCLINNRLSSDRGTSGLPIACEPIADIFALMGKYSEVEQAKAYFNKSMK